MKNIPLFFLCILLSATTSKGQRISAFPAVTNIPNTYLFLLEDPAVANYKVTFGTLYSNLAISAAITTNGNQFGASATLTLKSGAQATNVLLYGVGITSVPLTLTATAGQDGNMFNVKDYLGNILFAISYDGQLTGAGGNSARLSSTSVGGQVWTASGTTGIGAWATPSVSLATNGNQFGASTTLTIKSGVLLTNVDDYVTLEVFGTAFISTNLWVTGAVNIGSGSSAVGAIALATALGTNFQFEAPSTGTTDVVYRLPKNATTGVMVAVGAGGNTNQMTNVVLALNEVVTFNGSSYSAVALPVPGAASTQLVAAAIGTLSVTNLVGIGPGSVTNGPQTILDIQLVSAPTTNIIQWGTNGLPYTGAVKSNGVLMLPRGVAAFPAIGWAVDDDGTGTGFYSRQANEINIAQNGAETLRYASGGILGTTSFGIGGVAGNAVLTSDAAGTVSTRNVQAGLPLTNRLFFTQTGSQFTLSPTNAEWMESGYDLTNGWAFHRTMQGLSNGTLQPLVIGAGTNWAMKAMTNGIGPGHIAVQDGVYYPSNSFSFVAPTAASLGAGGYRVMNSNGFLVTIYSLNGSTTAMKVLAP